MSEESLLDEMMDSTLEGTEAAPEFIDPPNGRYHLKVEKVTAKETLILPKDSKQKVKDVRVTFQFSIVNTLELADPNGMQARDGDMFSISFLIARKQGREFYRSFLEKFIPADELDTMSLGQIIEAMPETEFEANVVCTTGTYTNVRLTHVDIIE